jgi:hypothetical protein
MHPLDATDEELWNQCEVVQTRRSGPGGQHRNKVSTAIVLTHRPTGIRVEARESREQSENRRIAISRLRWALAVRVRTERVEGSLALVSPYIRNRLLRIADENPDACRAVAIALDWLQGDAGRLEPLAEALQTTNSQLVRLLASHGPALAQANRIRVAHGLQPFRG